jgi:hypothetical protein
MYVYVYMKLYEYICFYIYKYICIYVCIYKHKYTCIHIHIYVYLHINILEYTYTKDHERGRIYCHQMEYSDLELVIENFIVQSRRTFSVMHTVIKGAFICINLYTCIHVHTYKFVYTSVHTYNYRYVNVFKKINFFFLLCMI